MMDLHIKKSYFINDPPDVENYVINSGFFAETRDREIFLGIFMTSQNEIIKTSQISVGGTQSSVADNQIICKEAIVLNAKHVILAHNHPNGNKNPSPADLNVTRKAAQALDIIGVTLLDHCIVVQSYTEPDTLHSIKESHPFCFELKRDVSSRKIAATNTVNATQQQDTKTLFDDWELEP
jgi:DNA repair protein RadC